MSALADVVQGIFEIQLVTRQHEQMVGFYRDLIGLAVTIDDPERGRTHFGLASGQLILAREHGEQVLADWPGVPPHIYAPEDRPVAGPVSHGPVHYAFDVDVAQWEAICERLERFEGVEQRGPLTWGSGFQSLYFKDPDGNVVELICATH